MDNTKIIKAEKRVPGGGKENKRLRKAGYLPANICSKGFDSISITIKADEFRKALGIHGRSAVYKIDLAGGKKHNVMVKDIQMMTSSGEYLNVDFQEISLKEKTKADVYFVIEGRELVEARRETINQQLDFITVIGLPNDIPKSITIDVSKLQSGDNMLIKDIELPKGITTEMDPEQLVLSLSLPRIQKDEEEEKEEVVETEEEQPAKEE